MASSDDEDCYLLDDVSEDDLGGIEDHALHEEDDPAGAGSGDGDESKNPEYVLETEASLRKRQDDGVSKVTELLSVPAGSAAALLRHCQWDPEQLQDRWFSDGNRRRVCDAVGLSTVAVKVNDRMRRCAICFVTHRRGRMRSARCSHYYCLDCWHGYVHAAVEEGSGPRTHLASPSWCVSWWTRWPTRRRGSGTCRSCWIN
ncbi:hypothetical protein PR202_gb23296 [Eleusine coracana subsp. coracana]|uniref:E3 ubiquitin-protein ligase ARIH1-like UBA-like domain-containing protein n=1 Tax=Eleusine coracana subsp. coracana TaxID=191504 RepID=A0AAV5FHU8_ELECO|nr:hypothetical protein PR202_gb23296 [Eleusine coracana subsp. coracana]